MAEQRLPRVNSDDGSWGTLLVQYLTKEHYNEDTDFSSNGGHRSVTLYPGTTTAAPLTFKSTFTKSDTTVVNASLLSTPVSGAMEYDGTNFYLTQGSVRRRIDNYGVTTQTASYTLAAGDSVVFANANGNNVTITLPSATSFTGYRFYVKRIDASATYAVTIALSGSDTLDGMASAVLSVQYQAIAVVSNGSNWFIL